MMQWHAHVTVAALAERNGSFLLVEEVQNGRTVLNQPAGHLERDETLLDATIRETREETAYSFTPEFIVGIYVYQSPDNGVTYLRVCFGGCCGALDPDQPLDAEINRVLWLDRDALLARADQHRSPLVMQCVNDFLAGQRYPMGLLQHSI